MSESLTSWVNASVDEESSSHIDGIRGLYRELFSSPGWHTSLTQFANATGLTVTLYDADGELRAGPFASTPLARCLVEAGCWDPASGVCLPIDRSAARLSIDGGSTVYMTGLNTLALFAVPVRLADETIGSVVAGWVFDNFPDPVATDRLARIIGGSFHDLWHVVRQQPPVGPEKLSTYSELLRTLCDLYMRERAETLQEQEQARGLRALYQSAQRLAAASTVEAIGEATVEAVMALANVENVQLLVVDNDGLWRVAASHGSRDETQHGGLASYPRAMTSTLRVPVEAADGSLLGIVETTNAEQFSERRRRTQMAALAAQTGVALHKTRLIGALQQERESLRRANRVKDEFLATLSHELRTPLAPILSWATILRETDPADQELFTSGLEAIERNAKQELHLVEEMLDLTRILNDKVVLEPAPVKPAEAVAAVAGLATSLIGTRDLRVEIDVESDLPMIVADAKRLQQILGNLVSNAVKFTADGGRIVIGARVTRECVDLFVADTGMGIKGEILPYIFDRFRQADSSSTRKHGGLGIGLSVVRGLVELHGGTVRAESPGEGRGATFTVSFPAIVGNGERSATSGGSDTMAPLDGSEGKREGKVLIVDDAIDTLISIKMLVERSGFRVQTANSVTAALEAARLFAPDIIVTDLGMPEQDGYDLLRIVRNDQTLASTPVVALTGFATMHDREAALQAGFVAHLPKPVEMPVLLAVLDRFVKSGGERGDRKDEIGEMR